ncbi:glycosyltransferase [Novosphingobium sp. TCA1]|uniref:glycosyltransferase n=1 Tax=Novosphingobium sp. TCA1 TaxID=2682474 RepID=UPI001306B64F|nr:glycosyltransferase [Novosphingobium sp. TCA1]GFE74808.1 glycosyl transferase family 2 [Novosphingobium sp. TCA1]
MAAPVFFDPTGNRRIRVRRLSLLALLLAIAACVVFATTVASVPAPPPLPIAYEHASPLPFRAQIGHLTRRARKFLFGKPVVPAPTPGAKPITVGFYTPWSDDSATSLERHIDRLDWVAPATLSVDGTGALKIEDDARLDHLLATSLHRPLVVPVLQNTVEGDWQGDVTARQLASPARRHALETQIGAYLDRTGYAGVMVDFETMPAASLPNLRLFLSELRGQLAPRHRVVAVTMPIDNPDWSTHAFASVADRLVLMAYDEHWQGGTPGPIASNPWFAQKLSHALAGLPRGKAIVALGEYAYNWHGGKADSMTVEEAWLDAHDSGTAPQYDPASGNAGYSYDDAFDGQNQSQSQRHDVWMLDAAATWNQMQILSRLGVGDIALWRLGSEDPGFWSTVKAWRTGTRPNLAPLKQAANVDVEGQGEILDVTATPQDGSRRIAFDPTTGMVSAERYTRLPTPYVVHRTGALPKKLALTFDDGPDPTWTPRILSILEQYHVPGTFFMVGENALTNRDLVKRITADGDEIGNHSYTHPNMAEEAATGIGLELNATQRLIEATTGHSIRLFRAPYFGDAEPTTADELVPAAIARQHGYTVVGLHVDPDDWKRPGVQHIIDSTIAQVESASPDRSENVILLHDGGGDRSQTVAALPVIIERLKQDGYSFVPVSTLAGLSHDAVMPKVDGVDLAAVRADVALFGVLAAILVALNWTFFFAISLGVLRSIGLASLASLLRRPQPMAAPEDTCDPLVTVIIPAYNEEGVIEASVRRVLESDYRQLQIIVADDGSKDRTSAIVSEAFAGNSRVELLTLVNGGKAAALNRALKDARGSVIVALDADTQFERETISRLVRWFADPRIGAVAGNAKVGNRVNLVTRWQGVEYVTAQNLERRALTKLDAIMVVPGAVGAWRREALDDVGGYPEDTLAEDQDLTIAIQRKGWKIAYDEDAVAWTEAPESFAALSKQRFRWSFGTLQCLWKHRGTLAKGRPSGLAFIGMPQAWLFQIVFAVISPAIDLALLISIGGTALRVSQHGWAQTQTDVLRMGAYWLAFTAVDLACGWIAYRLDTRRERFRPLLLLAQRFVYRQLMYSVVIRAVGAAFAGKGIGWGKLERTGRVTAAPANAAPPVGARALETV